MSKTKVTLSIEEDIWKNFRIYCIKKGLIASEEIGKFMKSGKKK